MTLEDLYTEMKDALRYFGITFGQKDEVKVRVEGDYIIFVHSPRGTEVRIPTSQ